MVIITYFENIVNIYIDLIIIYFILGIAIAIVKKKEVENNILGRIYIYYYLYYNYFLVNLSLLEFFLIILYSFFTYLPLSKYIYSYISILGYIK